MGCRYKIGDELVSIAVLLALLAVLGQKLSEHWAWSIPIGVLIVTFISGVLLNKRERAADKLRQAREAKQLALGVPPDEVI